MSIFGKKSNEIMDGASPIELSGPTEGKSLPELSYVQKRSNSYTIDQAIQLVGSLKEHKVSARVIAGIVKKTLESVDIHFSDIIADAKQKESAIHAETQKKDEMIKDLTNRVQALQSEKVDFQKELNKTVYVREFLQQALNDGKPDPAADKIRATSQTDTSVSPGLPTQAANEAAPANPAV